MRLRRRSDRVGKEAGKARGRQKMYKTVRLVNVYRIMTGSTAGYKASCIIDYVNRRPLQTRLVRALKRVKVLFDHCWPVSEEISFDSTSP
jgi:hypothetical protein